MQLSVHHHPKKYDKCAKLGIPYIVLPDKNIENMQLTCHNCDRMKVACVIVGVSVRIRILAKINTIARAKTKAKAAAGATNV